MSLKTQTQKNNYQSPEHDRDTNEQVHTRRISDFNSDYFAVTGNTLGSAQLEEFYLAIKEVITKTPEMKNFSVVKVDKNDESMVMSCLALVQEAQVPGEGTYLAVQVFPLEATIDALSPTKYNTGSSRTQFELPVLADDLINRTKGVLWERIRRSVHRSFSKVQLDNIWEAGYCIIPSEFDTKDIVSISKLIHKATNATSSLLEARPVTFNLSQYKKTTFRADIMFHNQYDATDDVGLPVRKDFVINVIGEDNDGSQRTLVDRGQMPLTHLSGYVDPLYVGRETYVSPAGEQLSTQFLLPKIVLTSTSPETRQISLELQLLSLASAGQIQRDDLFVHALQSRTGHRGEIHSLDGLSHEIEMPVDSRDPKFPLHIFYKMYFHNRPIYELHVPESDTLSWVLGSFVQAAGGNVDAQNEIFTAANNLTGGEFGRVFERNKGESIGMLTNDRIPRGYYEEGSGRQDLRNISYLAALNLIGASDMGKVNMISDAFNFTKLSGPEERTATLLKFYNEVLGNNKVHLKGWFVPVVLDPIFMVSLYEAVAKVGRLQINGYLEGFQKTTRDNMDMLKFGINSQSMHHHSANTTSGTSHFTSDLRGTMRNLFR